MSKWIIIIWTIFCIWGLVSGLNNVSQQQDLNNDFVAFGATIGIFFWLILWAVVVAPVALIGMLFRGDKQKQRSQTSVTPTNTFKERSNKSTSKRRDPAPTFAMGSARTVSEAELKSAESESDTVSEKKWDTLVKYNPDIQLALKKLSKYGNRATKEFQRAYMTLDDPTKIDHIVEIIIKDFSETR